MITEIKRKPQVKTVEFGSLKIGDLFVSTNCCEVIMKAEVPDLICRSEKAVCTGIMISNGSCIHFGDKEKVFKVTAKVEWDYA